MTASIVPAAPAGGALARAEAFRGFSPDPRLIVAFLASYKPGPSRARMRQAANTMARMLGFPHAAAVPWQALRYEHTLALRSLLEGKYAPAGANLHLSALRSLLEQAWRLGLLTREDLERACDLPPVRGSRLPRGRALAPAEVRTLFEKTSRARDLAMISLLYGAGLRRAEACALELDDYAPEARAVRVVGKGGKERLVPLPEAADAHVRAWLRERGGWKGPLLCHVHRHVAILPHRLTPSAVYERLRLLARRAGLASMSPHDLRRTFASELLDFADVLTVQGLLGHARPETTARYDRRGERARKAAVDRLYVPPPKEKKP